MNGVSKFHKATGPAFNVGERWVSSSKQEVQIVSVRKYEKCLKYADAKWDYDVTYKCEDGALFEKNAWDFQVRYQHIADLKL
jgi:hypothetical protein